MAQEENRNNIHSNKPQTLVVDSKEKQQLSVADTSPEENDGDIELVHDNVKVQPLKYNMYRHSTKPPPG